MDEKSYELGYNQAMSLVLSRCISALGYHDVEVKHKEWVLERVEIMSVLRRLCDDYGDNDWNDNLYIPDIIEKHLIRHLVSEEE